jgi:signal transduction histidine kinase
VLDHGAEVPAEVMEGWFAPHARAASATSRGTGLGLYIVRSIADALGRRGVGSALGARQRVRLQRAARPRRGHLTACAAI